MNRSLRRDSTDVAKIDILLRLHAPNRCKTATV